jgi:hypothetical protein
MPNYFTIMGERCSGTHFLQHAILKHFNLTYVKGEKHFFGNKEFRSALTASGCSLEHLTVHERQMLDFDKIDPNNLIVFCIVRDPVEWVDSFYKRKHHVPKPNREPFMRFVTCEWYSVYEEGPKHGNEIIEDRNLKTKQRYENLFELRRLKCKYMKEEMPKQYPHHIFIKYEDLRDNYEETLDLIKERFSLERKTNIYEPIRKYKGTYNMLYEKKPILLTQEQQQFIWNNVDIEQEQDMGYTSSVYVSTTP